MPETETVRRNIYILDQDTDPIAQQESSNLIHQRKEQLLEQLLFLPVDVNKNMFGGKPVMTEINSHIIHHLVEHV